MSEERNSLGSEEVLRAGVREVAAQEEPRKTRRSRLGGSADDFFVPDNLKRPGIDYQWFVMKVLNQEIDAGEHVAIADGGWEPVRPTEMPELMPKGYKGNTIDRKGQRLYKRPMYLTEEARREDFMLARQQKDAKLQQALATPNDSAPRVQSKIDISVGPPGAN